MKDMISQNIKESIKAKEGLLSQVHIIEDIAMMIINAYKDGRKVLICGNGGSAADSQHFSAELVGRFKKERRSLNAIALTVDTSILTAVGNDYGFDKIFSRQVQGLGEQGDILFAISTSGNSKNIIEAAREAKSRDMKIICMLGNDGGLMKSMGDINLIINNSNTARIQECHELVIHIICELIDDAMGK